MKSAVIFLFLLCSIGATAQSVNDYKYVVVQDKYEFQKVKNEYRLNELMYFLMEKYGFEVYMSTERRPEDSNIGGCNTLNLNVMESGFFWSDIYATLEDCQGNVVFTTATARSQEKDYKKAYYIATREAFESFADLNYAYNGGVKEAPQPQPALVVEEVQEDLKKATKEPIKKIEKVQENLPPITDVSITETTAIEIPEKVKEIATLPEESNQLEDLMDYRDPSSNEYALRFGRSKDNVMLYQHGARVGTGRRSGAGVYLMTTDSFTGIGFVENENFIIEYDINGSTQRIVLIK